jgi:hypothetical protein
MVKIGNREVIFHETLILPAGEDVWITASHGSDSVKLHFVMTDTTVEDGKPDPKAKPSIQVKGEVDHAVVTLANWKSGNTCLPIQIGKMDDGRMIFIMVGCSRMPRTATLTIQVMLGGAQ